MGPQQRERARFLSGFYIDGEGAYSVTFPEIGQAEIFTLSNPMRKLRLWAPLT